MTKTREIYRCTVCGNVVEVVNPGAWDDPECGCVNEVVRTGKPEPCLSLPRPHNEQGDKFGTDVVEHQGGDHLVDGKPHLQNGRD